METDRPVRGLDPQQRAAVLCAASPLAIIAAAGSGKTTVLTRRMARRIGDGSADAQHVLALTFTREAAGELRRRLRRLEIHEPVEIGTFHAVALRLLSDRALTAGRPAPVLAPDRGRLMREVLTETRRRIEASAALADLDWARARLVEPAHFADASRKVRRRSVLDAGSFADVAQRYAALKRKRGVVDFDDLLVDLLASLQRDATFADVVRWRFRHLFVDEAQDLNPLQFAVLEQIRAGRADVCLVGDHRQAIYGWNGAEPAMLLEVEQRIPGITVLALTGNHRCTPQIVRAGSAALVGAGIIDDTESRREPGRAISFITGVDEDDEAASVAKRVRAMTQRHGARQVAVLARTNDQLVTLERAVRALGFATEIATGRPGARSALDRTIAEAARISDREALVAWAEAVWTSDISDEVRRRVAEAVDRFVSSGKLGGFRGWVEACQPFDDLDPEPEDGSVTLATFHAAKGREWSGVVVTGVEAGLVPHSSSTSEAQRAEESRLLYVALTRASEELVISSASSRRGSPTKESPWISAVRTSVLADDPATAPPPDIVQRHRVPDPLAELKAWRAGIARAAGVAERAVCSDQILQSLHSDPPADITVLAVQLGVGVSAAARLAPKLFSLLAVPEPA